jgi:hypothetical protein
MDLKEADVIAVCSTYRTIAKKLMHDADALAGSRDLVRLTAAASTMEWAAGDLAKAAGISLPDSGATATEPEPKLPSNIVCLETAKLGAQLAIDLTDLYRAHVEPAPAGRQPERMAYVQAMDEGAARRRIALVLSAIEFVEKDEAAERISDCQSATRLIKQGVSQDRSQRLFEVGQKNGVPEFVRYPLFFLRDPAALALKWAEITRERLLRTGDVT